MSEHLKLQSITVVTTYMHAHDRILWNVQSSVINSQLVSTGLQMEWKIR